MNSYRPKVKSNTSGYKNISYSYENISPIRFTKSIYGKIINRYFNNLNDALWFKFVYCYYWKHTSQTESGFTALAID